MTKAIRGLAHLLPHHTLFKTTKQLRLRLTGGILHETLWVFCINGNFPALCVLKAQDGGLTWGPELPGAPVDCQSGGLSAHLIGADNGNFYRGQIRLRWNRLFDV